MKKEAINLCIAHVITCLFSILIVTLFFVSKGSSTSISEHQAFQTGSDLVALMDNQQVFDQPLISSFFIYHDLYVYSI